MMRALIVGGRGFVGGFLIEHLLASSDEVYIAALEEPETIPTFNGGRVSSVTLDITDSKRCGQVIQEIAPQAVYHLAGISFVPEAETDFERTLKVNVAGTANLARACHLMDKNIAFFFTSSAEVYGAVTPDQCPLREDSVVRPTNNYSLSKRMAELVVERYQRLGQIRAVIARPFNHIGPGQDHRFVASNFALQLARIAKGQAPPTLFVGNLEARRDFSDVRDIVRAYRALAAGGDGVFNLGSGQARSIQELLDTLIDISGLDVEIKQDGTRMRGPEVRELYGSFQKAKTLVGWEPQVPFRQTLEDIYHNWLDRVGSAEAA